MSPLSPLLPLIVLISLSFLLLHPSTALPRHRIPRSSSKQLKAFAGSAAAPPTTYFEVTKPINHPNTKPCSYHVLHHDFGNTYGKSPVFASYSPPTHCPSTEFSNIVLEWRATSKGRQFDRIFGVWLGGVELLRSCTAEPRPNGIVWKVEKDITEYYSLLMANQTLSVYMGNIVDSTYTGVYHVDIEIHFYPSLNGDGGGGEKWVSGFDPNSTHGYGKWADLIVPISRTLPLNDGLWFEIENSTDVQTKELKVPRNVYRAVLEVYVSFHENDEFWYSNLPNDYIVANNLSGMSGNGPFREVVVTLDGVVVGAVWPFTVIHTGGINPLLWRPISAIGSFDLPSYDIDITPFLGKLLDGKTHEIGFGVTNALNVWYIDANLHLWLDSKRSRTRGRFLRSEALPLKFSAKSTFKGLNGKFSTEATRSVSSIGWVRSSHGKITTISTQHFSYVNHMVMGNNANMQIVNQTILYGTSVSSKKASLPAYEMHSQKRFPLYLYTDELNQANDGYVLVANVMLGFDENTVSDSGFGFVTSSLKNLQNAQGKMVVQNNLVTGGVGSTQQVYEYDSSREPCYFRSVSSSNYTILYDNVRNKCTKRSMAGSSSRSGEHN